MAVRNILQIGDPRLKAKNKVIKKLNSPRIKKLIKDMIDTMRKNHLVGIAAPQIGENYKLFVTELRKTKARTTDQVDKLRVYINPKITHYSREKIVIYEGCGSVAHGELFAPVKRPKQITIEFLNPEGARFRLVCDGLLARVIQHEYDHLSGVEFVEKILNYKKIISRNFYIKEIKTSPAQVEASKITVKQLTKIT